jgi:hypothetical protein
MPTTMTDRAGCGCEERDSGADGILPANPFTALQYHFGMLLGVDDLETAAAYPRGKMRMHNAWLHREGVVWGLDVGFNSRRELSVSPGLALDAAGHELHLDATACVDLGKWYDKHRSETDFSFIDRGHGRISFDVHVVARFRACLARPVPAIADPCAGSESDTAFSRVSETIELLIRPGKAPPKDRGYHRLRILFSLEDDSADYDEVKLRRDSILIKPYDEQPRAYLDAFREFAALDEIDLFPERDSAGETTSIFPEDPSEVVLADIESILINPSTDEGRASTLADPLPVPNVRVRPSHVATATIQELLCGPLFAMRSGPSRDETGGHQPPGGESPEPDSDADAMLMDAGGPRVESISIASARRINVTATKGLDVKSVGPEQFSVTTYTSDDGWSTLDIGSTKLDSTATKVAVNLKESMTPSQIVRFIARGTGPQPILGTDLIPLAGAVGGPSGSANDGIDFVIMLRS